MKTSILRTLISIGFSATLCSVSLQAQDQIRATIPFNFQVGSQTFAAGEYSVAPIAPTTLLIRNVNTHAAQLVPTNGGQRSSTPGHPTLTFNHYGDAYFLAKIGADNRGWEVPPSKAEKEHAAAIRVQSPVVVAASVK